MDTIFKFGEADFGNLELVRQIVLNRLKKDTDWNQFDYTWDQGWVDFEPQTVRPRFVTLANEIMWQLIIQGVLTVGMNSHNPNLPFFRITDYGDEVLKVDRFIPHDPTKYLYEIDSLKGTITSDVCISYIEEALRCFGSGCNAASVLLLGVATECAFNNFCVAITPHLKNPADASELDLKNQVRPRHRWLVNKFNALDRSTKKSLSESLDVNLGALYDLIRRQRNDLGHPQSSPPDLSREQSYIFFRILPEYLRDMQEFADYCQKNGL